MLWLVASIALEAAFNPLSACWNAISYPLQNLLNVLEGDIAQGTKIKDESPVASCNSRNRANLHGCRSHFLVVGAQPIVELRQLCKIRVVVDFRVVADTARLVHLAADDLVLDDDVGEAQTDG